MPTKRSLELCTAALVSVGLIVAGCQPGPGAPTVAPRSTVAPPVPTIAPPIPTSAPTPTQVNKRGVHLLLDDGNVQFPRDVWNDHLAWAARLVGPGGYVVQLIRSNDLDPTVWQPFFDGAARERLVPIIRLATHKSANGAWWVTPETDSDGLSYHGSGERIRRFLEAIRWQTNTVLVTVGNEPNRADEWGGAADAAAYARFLRDTRQALRAVSNVRVLVLNAALDPYAPSDPGAEYPSVDSERFLEQMERSAPGLLGSLDGWASHAYPLGPFTGHPRDQEYRIDDVRPDPMPRRTPLGLSNRGINGHIWELWKLESLGVQRKLPVYITESGWRHARSQVRGAADSMNASVDDATLARYIGLAYEGPETGAAAGWVPWNHDPRVRAAALFALGGAPRTWGHTNLVTMGDQGNIVGPLPFGHRLSTVSLGTADCLGAGTCD